MRRHDPAGVFGTKDGDGALSEEAADESPEDAAERFGLSPREEEGVQEAGAYREAILGTGQSQPF